MRKIVAASLLLSWLSPAVVHAFPIDLQSQFDGVSIEAEASDMSNIATVLLRNSGESAALCEASFVNGPERPTPRRVKLAAGESTTISQSFLRAITRVRITLNCHAS
ncbi:3-phosphoglycerate kinase [Halopseudomonas maritima]|uniref:3-phosphoglycerate kinase n=1 Tax=Halopseudomonas maritima TaxID=2918528 RepID=UPI001EEBBA3E|nr:3-phosphoglycerate kinase [Halopseudomonas maritima]UJJ31872.1 3-phosphoglycerate kinase [Halopseudomonas maritima]